MSWAGNELGWMWFKAFNKTHNDALYINQKGEVCCEDPKIAKTLAPTIRREIIVERRIKNG